MSNNDLIEMQEEYNSAIDFALDEASLDGILFLRMWREGAWDEIAQEFPEFKGPLPGVKRTV